MKLQPKEPWMTNRLIIGITGASGVIYDVRMLEALKKKIL
jgi:3-polyprenyl-4-hydroxybenzoate decarboxylase